MRPRAAVPHDAAISARAPSEREDEIRSEQVRMLYRTGPVGVLGAAAAAFMLAGVVLARANGLPLAVAVWLGCVSAVVAGHLTIVRRYRMTPAIDVRWREWGRRFAAFGFMEGLIWGASSLYSAGTGSFEFLLVTMLVVACVASGSVAAFGIHLPSFFALMLPATAPCAGVLLWRGDPADLVLGGGAILFIVTFSFIAIRSNATIVEAFRLRVENIDLAADLRRQKDAADEANVAKSRFLAAASHDLRQPVHALSLFVGALSAHRLSDEAERLVGHIDSSVHALDGLFSALLDISRLDAGVVEPRLQSVALQPLFNRLSQDFVADATARGLTLRFHDCSLSVRTDPQLLERILRNLVSNALKYTQRGRVVVGCRRGARLQLQVWDTGRGIPADDVNDVFAEFHQLDNPERDRAKGLGLGLAIVRRLTTLLDHPVSVRSVVGKGSMFGISLPLAAEEKAAGAAAATGAPSLARGLVLVIDDEIAIQEAMRSLLTSWGHDVICAGSGADMIERVAACRRRPDLIVCDYRLRGDENGIATIRQLQLEYNEDIPALLITGDTAPDRLSEARESGFLLLHKPVPNGRLRAAITNLMARRASG